MEKSTSTASQTAAEPPPSSSTSLPATLPTGSSDQRSSPRAMDLDSPPVVTTPAAAAKPRVGGQVAAPPSDPSVRGRKRALEGNLEIEKSNYYQMRLLVKDLRPQVLQLLGTPDFRNCKAAMEIQEKMKLILDLYHEMIGQTPKREKTSKSESLSNGNGDHKVVGGSAFGWNFITYGGTDAVYCGLSKEEYRASHPVIQPEVEAPPNTL